MTIGQFQSHLAEFTTAAAGAALTVDLAANGFAQAIPLNSSSTPCVLSVTNPKTHCYVTLRILQDGTGGRKFTLPAAFVGSVPPPNPAANASTIYEFYFNGTNYYCTACTGSVAQPNYHNTYYVNSAFTGAQLGTDYAPFTSMAAVVAVDPLGALVFLPPFGVHAENFVSPTGPTGWDIECQDLSAGTTISGTFTAASSHGIYGLKNVILTGNFSGDATSSQRNELYVDGCLFGSNLALTASGGGSWLVVLAGFGPPRSHQSGYFTGAISIAGSLYAESWEFNSSVTLTGGGVFSGCQFNAGATSIAIGAALLIQNTTFAAAPTFTGAAVVTMDGFSHASARAVGGPILAGGATLVILNDVDPSGITPGSNSQVLTTVSGVTVWAAPASGLALSTTAPADVAKAAAAVGTGSTAARSDHKHDVSTAITVTVGTANAEGIASSLARSDHTHAVAGLLIAAQAQGDFIYFNGTAWVRLPAGTSGQVVATQGPGANPIYVTPLAVTGSAPVNVTKVAAAVGVATDAARSDHKHDVTTAIASSVGAVNAEGTAASLARSDHTHAVVNLAITGQAWGDFVYFNGTNWVRLPAGTSGQVVATQGPGANPIYVTPLALTASAPANVTKAAAAAGVATDAARSDHKHDVSTAAAVSVSTANAEGVATTLARSDHTHAVTGLNVVGQTKGDILFFDGSAWSRLAAGVSGKFLETLGAAANPAWATPSSTQISDASSLGGPSVHDSLETIHSVFLSLTSDQVGDNSGISGGGSVTNALLDLKAQTATGDFAIQLVSLDGIGWTFFTTNGWTANGGGDVHANPIGPIRTDRNLVQVKVRIAPVTAHGALPATMPTLVVCVVSGFGTVTTLSSVTDPSSSVSEYETPHDIVCNGFVTAGGDHSFFFVLTAENGLHAVSGCALVSATMSLST